MYNPSEDFPKESQIQAPIVMIPTFCRNPHMARVIGQHEGKNGPVCIGIEYFGSLPPLMPDGTRMPIVISKGRVVKSEELTGRARDDYQVTDGRGWGYIELKDVEWNLLEPVHVGLSYSNGRDTWTVLAKVNEKFLGFPGHERVRVLVKSDRQSTFAVYEDSFLSGGYRLSR